MKFQKVLELKIKEFYMEVAYLGNDQWIQQHTPQVRISVGWDSITHTERVTNMIARKCLPACQSLLQPWVSLGLLYNLTPPGGRFLNKLTNALTVYVNCRWQWRSNITHNQRVLLKVKFSLCLIN
jgi:hypothetical protein